MDRREDGREKLTKLFQSGAAAFILLAFVGVVGIFVLTLIASLYKHFGSTVTAALVVVWLAVTLYLYLDRDRSGL